jgi:hypothetical protein
VGYKALDNKYTTLRGVLSEWLDGRVSGRIVPLAGLRYVVESAPYQPS